MFLQNENITGLLVMRLAIYVYYGSALLKYLLLYYAQIIREFLTFFFLNKRKSLKIKLISRGSH